MADDKKKPKIDLKARLKQTNLGTQTVPLPVPGGSQPPASSSPMPRSQNIAPPPGISPGIPVPPFAGAPTRAASIPPPPKPTVVQQTIKVEVGEEIIKEREKAKKRLYMVAAGTALVGLIIGYPVGGAAARNERGKTVIESTKGLLADIKESNAKMKELDGLLAGAAEQLQKKQYPNELAGQLASINIPFDASKVDGSRIAGLKGSALRSLLKYTSSVEDLNKKKDSLKNILDALKPSIEKAWKEEKEPVASYSVVFRSDPKGVVGELVPNKDAFVFGGEWPKNYAILKPERTQQGIKMAEKATARYLKGDVPGAQSDTLSIPLDPSTTMGLTDRTLPQLAKAFRDMREELEGIEHPTEPVDGLIKQGDNLATELQKVTAGG